MTAREQKLVDIYTKASEDLYSTIVEKTAKGNSTAYQRTLLKQTNQILADLQGQSISWVENEISPEYNETMKRAQKATAKRYGLTVDEYNALGELTQEQFAKINKKAIETIVDEKVAQFSVANSSLKANMQDVISQKFAQGLTAKETQKAIIDELYGSLNGKAKITINGRNYDPRKYGEMAARAAVKETQNTVAFNEGKSVGSKVIAMSRHKGACNICIPLQDRWYSNDKDYKKYPYIWDTAWKSGYKLPHPSCEHSFFTIIEELETDGRIEDMTSKSNKEFEVIGKDDKRVQAYFKTQKKKADMWRDKQQYERYVARLGDDAPKSFSGFRRMKKSNNDNWIELQEEYRASGMELKQVAKKQDVKFYDVTVEGKGTEKRSQKI